MLEATLKATATELGVKGRPYPSTRLATPAIPRPHLYHLLEVLGKDVLARLEGINQVLAP